MRVKYGTVLQNIATGEVGITMASGEAIITKPPFYQSCDHQTLYKVRIPNEDGVYKPAIWAEDEVRVLPISRDPHQSLYNKEEDVMEEVGIVAGNVVFHLPTQRLGIIIRFFDDDEGENEVMVAVSNTRYEDWDLEDVKLIATNEDVLAAFSDVR